MDDFYKACLSGTPTPAHLAIRDIVEKKRWGLLTENLDLLHQRSGINPLHHEGKDWLNSNVSVADLKKIDYVITLGLARDESGFLGWYKTVHPGRTIIAINLHQPSYQDDNDLFVRGDVQSILPLLRERFFRKKTKLTQTTSLEAFIRARKTPLKEAEKSIPPLF